MRSIGGAMVACALIVSGCSFHNVIYNSQRLYTEAEVHRRAGRESLSTARYLDVIRKTGQALSSRPDSEWADEALFLLGRSRLRLRALREARVALEAASERTDDPRLRSEILVYLAMVQTDLGDGQGALERVSELPTSALTDGPRAEAHLLRARILLAASPSDQGWWELDRASAADPATRVEVGLERLRWAIAHGDEGRSHKAFKVLLSYAEGGLQLDSILSMVGVAADRWGSGTVAELLVDVDSSSWDRTARGRIALERARRLNAAGDTAGAAGQARRVAEGFGGAATDARLLLSAWKLEHARDLSEVHAARAILFSAGDDPRARGTLTTIAQLDALTSLGFDDSLGWFAAAEVARERLGAKYLARGLFLAYADGAGEEPWAPKALLAALEASLEEGDRAWLRGRLEEYGGSPYVVAAHGGFAAGFEALEEELEMRLRQLTGR